MILLSSSYTFKSNVSPARILFLTSHSFITAIFGDSRLLETYLGPPKEIEPLVRLGSPTAAIRSNASNALEEVSISQQESATGSSPETAMILLFHAMGGPIPRIFFDLASYTQQRFDKDGKQYEVTPHYTALDQALVHLLDATKLRQNIEHLISRSTISVQGTAYVYHDDSARDLFERSREYWIRQAFMLCCYVFPRSSGTNPL